MLIIPRDLLDIGWNDRPLGFTDFEYLADKRGIVHYRAPIITRGIYLVEQGVEFIALPQRDSGVRLEYSAFHELGHAIYHAPGVRFFSESTHRKAEREANIIALCAVLPYPLLMRILFEGDLHYFPRPLVNKRERLLITQGM